MAVNKYYDSDCNLGVLDGKTVAVIGFGGLRLVCRRKGGPEHGQFPGQQRVRPGG